MKVRFLIAAIVFALAASTAAQQHPTAPAPLVIQEQGSFFVGGTVVTNPGTFDLKTPTPAGQTIHGDHSYVQYQIPVGARQYPLVMWHGGGQFSKSWETTPDGREGFQSIFLRRGFATYIFDQPRHGRASRTTERAPFVTRIPDPGPYGEQSIFVRFRIGIWPDYFPGVQFSRDPAAVDEWWRQQVPDTGPIDNDLYVRATVALFEKIGPAVLLTHSASGVMGWQTAIKTPNVKGIVAYEPVGWVFPEGEVPAAFPTSGDTVTPTTVSRADFEKLTKLPIQIVYGDNIPEMPSTYGSLDVWRGRLGMAARFVEVVNAHGGDAQLLHLPKIGVRGNTHFPFSDLNNARIADLLSEFLQKKGLDAHR